MERLSPSGALGGGVGTINKDQKTRGSVSTVKPWLHPFPLEASTSSSVRGPAESTECLTSRSRSAVFSSARPKGFAKLKAVRFYKDQRGRHALNKADVDTGFKKNV